MSTPFARIVHDTHSEADVLVVFPFCLDHAGHGNIQRILNLSRYLADSGFLIDLVYQGNPRIPMDRQLYGAFRQVHRVLAGVRSHAETEMNRQLSAFYAGFEMPARHLRPAGALTALVRSLLEAKPYRAVISTYAWTAPIFARLAQPVLRILDVQDILHEHAEACRSATGGSTSFVLPRETEEYLWRQWDVLLAISPEDQARIEPERAPDQRSLCVRHALEIGADDAVAGEDDLALYAGSDNLSNIQATNWLLDEVWPKVVRARPHARLRISGLICRALPDRARRLPGVEIAGYQPDLSGAIESCGVVVAPYLYGSGLKIKVVEAACQGKAILTTSAGLVGSGLEPGRSIAVHDSPDAFAEAFVSLLANRDHRRALGSEALVQARNLFSRQVCYEPVAEIINNSAPGRESAFSSSLTPEVIDRAVLVCRELQPTSLVVWGNGSHTRSLIAGLSAADVRVTQIADRYATQVTSSSEGIPVVPWQSLDLRSSDLIILSSETFEHEMWADVVPWREAGVSVLGLYDPARISSELLDRVTSRTRAALGVVVPPKRPAGAPFLAIWDSAASPSRWWRQLLVQQIARAAERDGYSTAVALPIDAGVIGPELEPWSVTKVLPVLESAGDDNATDLDVGLWRARIAARNLHRLTTVAGIDRWTTLLLVAPTAEECFGLASALCETSDERCPAIALHFPFFPPNPAASSRSDSRFAPRLRAAQAALFEACRGRLILTAGGERTAAALRPSCRFPLSVWVSPAAARAAPSVTRRTRIVCVGDVTHARTPLLLQRVGSAVHAGACGSADGVAWRSDTGTGSRGGGPHEAHQLAARLGLDLLDDAGALQMRTTLEGAAAIAVLHGSSNEEWVAALVERARTAAVPVLVPGPSLHSSGELLHAFAADDPDSLVAQLRQVLECADSRVARPPESTAASRVSATPAPWDRLVDQSPASTTRLIVSGELT